MPRRCFLGCDMAGHTRHVFPNPKRQPEQFKKWVQICGGKLNTADDYVWYRKQSVCDRHFTLKDRNRNNRLNSLAVPFLLDATTIVRENPMTVKSELASTVVDMEEDPLKITEDPISNTGIIADVLSPHSPEGISCPSPIKDIAPPQVEEATVSCTRLIVDNSPPKPTVAQQSMYPGSDVLTALQHTYSKVPDTCNLYIPDGKLPVPEKTNVAACRTHGSKGLTALQHTYSKVPETCNPIYVPDSKFPVSEKTNVAACRPHGSNVLTALQHTYSKVPETCVVPNPVYVPDSKFQVPEKTNVASCRANDLLVSRSKYNCQQHKLRLLRQQVCKLKKRCLSYKNRLAQALKPSVVLQKVTKNMTEPAKLFFNMQLTQTRKKPGGRRFTSEEKDFSVSLYQSSPQSYSFLAHCFTLPSVKTIKAILAQEKLQPYLTLDKNATLPSNKTVLQERLEPYLTLDKSCTSPIKITLKDMLAKDNFEPYLILEPNSSLPCRITLKDILAHKQREPYLTFSKDSTSPSKTTPANEKPEPHRTLEKDCTSPSKTAPANEKPEPHRTLKKKFTSPSKKAVKGISAREKLEPYLTFNKNSIKTYVAKKKASTQAK